MRKIRFLVALLSVCLFSTANAAITNWNCEADGDGAIETDGAIMWEDLGLEDGINSYRMSMDATQAWGPAHMQGDFFTDTPADPIVYLMEDVDNQTGFTWTGYEFKVFMDNPFAITAVFAPLGWNYTLDPILPNQPWPHNPSITGYMGVVNFTSTPGNELDPGDIGTFGVKLQFDGTVAFCTEQTPIPEPATMAMLGFGALGLLRRKK